MAPVDWDAILQLNAEDINDENIDESYELLNDVID